MNKELKGFVLVFVLVLVLSLTFVSAGWFGDTWSKITGEATTSTSKTVNTKVMETSKENETEIFCNEADDGQDYFNRGITTNMDGSKEDFCLGGESLLSLHTNLTEYYCFDGEEIAEENVPCEFGCLFGACLKAELPENACLDTDKQNDPFTFGRVFMIEAVYIDECIDEVTLEQPYCAGAGGVGKLTTICEAGCDADNGVCFEGGTTTTGNECYDTDPLNDIYDSGSVISGLTLKTDQCISSPKAGNLVVQYECGVDGGIVSLGSSSCGNDCEDGDGNTVGCGCSSGACESPPATVYPCEDSDGIIFLTKGQRTIDGGATYEYDYCPEEGGAGVMEYFCMNPPNYELGGNPHNSVQDCTWLDDEGKPTLSQQNADNYCSEGVCVLANAAGSGGNERPGEQTFFKRVGNFFKGIFGSDDPKKVDATGGGGSSATFGDCVGDVTSGKTCSPACTGAQTCRSWQRNEGGVKYDSCCVYSQTP